MGVRGGVQLQFNPLLVCVLDAYSSKNKSSGILGDVYEGGEYRAHHKSHYQASALRKRMTECRRKPRGKRENGSLATLVLNESDTRIGNARDSIANMYHSWSIIRCTCYLDNILCLYLKKAQLFTTACEKLSSRRPGWQYKRPP